MKVLRGQEASLELKKGLYRGSKTYLNRGARAANIHAMGFLGMYENLWKCSKSKEFHENL